MIVWLLLLALALILANGFFVGAEFSFTASRATRLQELESRGDRRAALALRSIAQLPRMLTGAQLGITMASLGLGYIGEPTLERVVKTIIDPLVDVPPEVTHSVSLVVGLLIVVFLHMVLGEMVPKYIAIAQAETTALWLAPPFRLFITLFAPLVKLVDAIANAGTRLFGVDPNEGIMPSHTADEIGTMIEESAKEGVLDRFEERLLSGAIGFTEKDAEAAMVPRIETVAVALGATPAEIEKAVLESGHSRLPVYAGDLDHIAGFVHVKDLLEVPETERDRPLQRRFIRQMLVVPESAKLQPLLFDMRRQRRHFALVIDEHGGTAGIVTLEDLLEELVGDIRDEYDIGEAGIERLGDGRFVVPGALRIDEAATYIGLDLPDGEYDTVAGFLMDRLGRIPKRRDIVEHDGWRLRVRNMQRRRVVQLLVERTGRAPEATGPPERRPRDR